MQGLKIVSSTHVIKFTDQCLNCFFWYITLQVSKPDIINNFKFDIKFVQKKFELTEQMHDPS